MECTESSHRHIRTRPHTCTRDLAHSEVGSPLCLCLHQSFLLLCLLCLLQLCLLLACQRLLLEGLSLHLLSLFLVDSFDEHALVLVLVTLGLHIEEVVKMLVNLLLLTVLSEQPSQYTQTTHPEHLCWHPCFACSTALASTHVTTLALGLKILADARS